MLKRFYFSASGYIIDSLTETRVARMKDSARWRERAEIICDLLSAKPHWLRSTLTMWAYHLEEVTGLIHWNKCSGTGQVLRAARNAKACFTRWQHTKVGSRRFKHHERQWYKWHDVLMRLSVSVGPIDESHQ